MITTEIKKNIVAEIKNQAASYSSAAKQAVAYNVSSSQLSRIKGELGPIISTETFPDCHCSNCF